MDEEAESIGKVPELCVLFAIAINAWSKLEIHLGWVLTKLLSGNEDAGIAMFHSLVTSTARRHALEAAARTVLSPDDFDLFSVLLRLVDATEKRRNDLAHGDWSFSRFEKDALVFTPANEARAWAVAYAKHHSTATRSSITIGQKPASLLYKKSDFEALIRDIKQVHDYLKRFWAPAYVPNSSTAAERLQLSSEPEIQKALSRLRANRQSSPVSPPKPPRKRRPRKS